MEIIKGNTMNFKEIRSTSEYLSDDNCCTVVASSIAFNTPFKEMQNFFFNEMGRKRNKGIRFETKQVEKVAKKFGYKITLHKTREFKNNGFLTPNNCNRYLDRATYLLGCKGHVLAFKNGIVEDWTQGRKHYINRIWKVEEIVKTSQNSFNDFINSL